MNQRLYERQYHVLKKKKDQFFGPDKKMLGFIGHTNLNIAILMRRRFEIQDHFLFIEPNLTFHIGYHTNTIFSNKQFVLIQPYEILKISLTPSLFENVLVWLFSMLLSFLIMGYCQFFNLFMLLLTLPIFYILKQMLNTKVLKITTRHKTYKFMIFTGILHPYQTKAIIKLKRYISLFKSR